MSQDFVKSTTKDQLPGIVGLCFLIEIEICLICVIYLPKIVVAQWSHILVFSWSYSCLTLVIFPFTLTAFTFGLCLYCASVSYFKDG